MAQSGVATALVVEFGGSPLPAKFVNTLVEGYVDDSRTLPDLFLLRFRDPDRVLLEQTGLKIGSEARLLARAGGDSAPKPLLKGVVTALEVELDETGTFTVVRGLDESHRLFRGRRVASYQNMTLADICAQVAQRAGLKPGTVDVAGPVLEHIAQPNVTDWEFIRDLAEEAGAQAYVLDGQLHITRPAEASGAPDGSARADRDPLVLEMGSNLLRCRAGVSSAEQVSEVEVRGWDVKAKQPLVGRAPAGKSATLELGVSAAEVSAPFGEARFVVTDAAYGAQAQVDQAAKALAERIAGSFAELEAVIRGNPEVRAGSAVALNAVGAPFEGRYTVTSSRHVFDPVRGYETWLTVSGQQERSLFGLTGGGPGSGGPGAGSGGGSRCAGLVSGTVTDTHDPEGSGRVKVRFPWLSDEYASDWARTAQSGGTSGGEAFIPEVGDEVLVGFEHGHLDRPYVLAGLYNGKDRPSQGSGGGGGGGSGSAPAGAAGAVAGAVSGSPDTSGSAPESAAPGAPLVDPTSGAVNRRSIASKSGNQLELLDDANGPQGVRLLTGDGKLKIDLDRKGTVIVINSDGSVNIEAQQQVSIKAARGVALDGGQGTLELSGDSVTLKSRSGVSVDGGTGEVKLSTGGTVAVQGGQVTVDGTQRTDIKSGGSLAVNAPMVKIN
ncbi:VgrG-related protein [Streptomyces sp. NBC_00053]|uniref:VgrG-related protein n=1 Tax=unclassified Streptomyces TaxID=2593676 RepID=UPI000F5BC739|nr:MULTISPECIES: VgrG-related protein [unclassified Streptomyces]WSX02812.1 VgrG-related protein [Streptomyces sp. NBC_00987]MCX4395270.1 VgrG-related protein [Streptomyces sp. NBC_01767]MCX5501925.1 VgrG-related protein [Streptomyces sp. NBC_00052]MCX5549539.1 VgrG-related protein [Streptomyces sp. NBC_00051]RPK67661.1 Phage late control gene D protein (GPD) [Streptomyces sp. ADI95-17]